MTRFWLITSTTYGTWLPGDERGFVSAVANDPGPRVRHNEFGSLCDADMPQLRESARRLMRGPAVLLTHQQALVTRDQFLDTVAYRHWTLHAAAVMSNHFHALVEAAADVPSKRILGDLKAYASRSLNKGWAKPASGTWWTESGSRRPLPDERAVQAAILYVVRRQHQPLTVWYAPQYATLVNRNPT